MKRILQNYNESIVYLLTNLIYEKIEKYKKIFLVI